MLWKALTEVEKQQNKVDLTIKEAGEKLET